MTDTREDIESMCADIKHTPELVDLGDVRVLLRRAQFENNTLRELMGSATFPGYAVLRALDEVSE